MTGNRCNIQFVIPSQTLRHSSQRLLPLIWQLRRVLPQELYRSLSTKMAECFVVGFVRNLYPITLTAVIALPGF